MTPEEFLKNKKVLVVILGTYGGGVATAKWLFRHGAKVSVTDLRTEKELANQIRKFTGAERKNIKLILGGQHEKDFRESDLIVAGPGVPDDSKYLQAARKAGIPIENEASLFFRFVKRPVIAVTGTRGKTTVSFWISELLSKKYPRVRVSGNAQTSLTKNSNPLLAEIDRVKDTMTPVVAELSSWHLERVPLAGRSAHVAVITNLFHDHMNRYGNSMEKYALAKANIFAHQTKDDFLVLNKKNPWTKFFLAQKSKSQKSFFQDFSFTDSFKKTMRETLGEHNFENLQAAASAVQLFDPKIKVTEKMLGALPSIPFRQETIFEKNGLVIVNDSTATSPDATSAAIKRFCKNKDAVLITGGTDKELDFKSLAKDIKNFLVPERVIFLNGSGTKKLLKELELKKEKKVFETLADCFSAALDALPKKKGTILFSPGAASFEKFKNEFNRGEKFNVLVEKLSPSKKKTPVRTGVR